MKRNSYFPFAILLATVFFLINLPKAKVEGVRSLGITILSYPWRGVSHIRHLLLSAPTLSERHAPKESQAEALLLLENEKLKDQLEAVNEWLLFHERIESDVDKMKLLSKQAPTDGLFWREFFQRRSEELKKILEMQIQALPANVIYREPSSWNSSLWLNVGDKNNEAIGKQIVQKNSIVLKDNNLIGIVEYVEKNKCRVRLITDSGLIPSVRAIRGKEQNKELCHFIDGALERLSSRDDLFENEDEKKKSLLELTKLKEKAVSEEDRFLAKGELMGSALPLFRLQGKVLKGIGFNYDFSDAEGPAREIRTGKILEKTTFVQKIHEPLIKKGDLLVTTGLDGVFPAGLPVAFVTEVLSLEEGSFTYEIRAKSTAGDLDDLSTLFVIPPLEVNVLLDK